MAITDDISCKMPHNIDTMTDRDQQPTNKTNTNSGGGNVFNDGVSAEGDVVGGNIIHNYYATQNPDEKPADPWEQFSQMPIDEVAQPALIPPNSFLLHRHNQNFVGRTDQLRLIAGLISGRLNTAQAAIALTGLGGIGKTQLATEFCHRYGRYFAGGVFLA